MVWLRLALLIGFFAIATIIALDTVRKRRIAALVPGPQFRLRVFIAVLFLLEIVLMFVGTYFLEQEGPLIQILYWSGCLILALLIIVFVVLDVRGVLINYMAERRSILRNDLLNKRDD